MTLSRPQRYILTAAAAAGLMAGGVGIAGAVTGRPPLLNSSSTAGEAPSYTSSVTVVDNATDNNANDTSNGNADTNGKESEHGNDPAETAQLQGLAKITSDQASQAAVAAVPGTPSTPELQNENGNVVWGVEVRTANGSVDVKVDAGNGTVLAQDSAGGNDHTGGTAHPEGSAADD